MPPILILSLSTSAVLNALVAEHIEGWTDIELSTCSAHFTGIAKGAVRQPVPDYVDGPDALSRAMRSVGSWRVECKRNGPATITQFCPPGLGYTDPEGRMGVAGCVAMLLVSGKVEVRP